MRVLLLGGTGEARALAALLHERGIDFISSLAGRVSNPAVPIGPVRIGGFGGVDGLARYLADEAVTAVVDATHPFAATITRHAVAAATGPLLLLRRPGWTAGAGDDWRWVADINEAAVVVAAAASGTVFLTTGKRDLDAFAGDSTRHYLVRVVDPPTGVVPPRMTLLLDRGPYVVERERALMIDHDVSLLVTKDSGGSMTVAKLTAARELGVPVIMVDRPPVPEGVTVVDTVGAAFDWVTQLPADG